MSVRKYPQDPTDDNSICVLDLPDSCIAQITQWGGHLGYSGRYVQRCGMRIVALGEANCYWVRDELSVNKINGRSNLRVKILPNGYLLEITDNQSPG